MDRSKLPSGRDAGRRSALTAAAGLAVIIIATAALLGAQRGTPETALARAQPGTYAIVIQASERQDTVVALPLADPGARMALATIDHLPGYTVTGSVSPDGRTAALVVTDRGSLSRPVASLVFVDLAAGTSFRTLTGIDPRQQPPWDPGSTTVAVARSARTDSPSGAVAVLAASLDGEVRTAATFATAAGAFPFAIDGNGAVVSCVIDASGSSITRDGDRVLNLGPYITRDWVLSPDGSAVAYTEVNTEAGVRYYPRVATLAASVSRDSISVEGSQSLGVAWSPGNTQPTFGRDPATALTADEGGFDVPIAYSPSGLALAVAHWTGDSYDSPGHLQFEAITDGDRTVLEPATRFLGWAER